jgi:hypothetical protein
MKLLMQIYLEILSYEKIYSGFYWNNNKEKIFSELEKISLDLQFYFDVVYNKDFFSLENVAKTLSGLLSKILSHFNCKFILLKQNYQQKLKNKEKKIIFKKKKINNYFIKINKNYY